MTKPPNIFPSVTHWLSFLFPAYISTWLLYCICLLKNTKTFSKANGSGIPIQRQIPMKTWPKTHKKRIKWKQGLASSHLLTSSIWIIIFFISQLEICSSRVCVCVCTRVHRRICVHAHEFKAERRMTILLGILLFREGETQSHKHWCQESRPSSVLPKNRLLLKILETVGESSPSSAPLFIRRQLLT